MNNIKISCELPNCMLNMNCNLNDYDFVLFHLYATNSTYREYYKALRKYRPGRLMILDNSAYEFFVNGEELDIAGYITVINELKPDMYIIPDFLMKKEKTIESVRTFRFKNPKLNRHLPQEEMAVAQGDNAQELNDCLRTYKEMGISCVAIPFHNSFLKELGHRNVTLCDKWRLMVSELRHPYTKSTSLLSSDDYYAMGRVTYLQHPETQELLSEFKHVHLLGSHNPLEKRFEEEMGGLIKTMDTGYPVKCAIAGHELGKEPGKPDIIIDQFLDDQLSASTKKLIASNVRKFADY